MKKLLIYCLLLALCCTSALAQAPASPYAPYVLATPEDALLTTGESSCTFERGTARVVAMAMSRVPDADPEAALVRLMSQFDPANGEGVALSLSEGFLGLLAVSAGKLEGLNDETSDVITVMVLQEGELLILSGYDMENAHESVFTLLNDLLAGASLNGQSLADASPIIKYKEIMPAD